MVLMVRFSFSSGEKATKKPFVPEIFILGQRTAISLCGATRIDV